MRARATSTSRAAHSRRPRGRRHGARRERGPPRRRRATSARGRAFAKAATHAERARRPRAVAAQRAETRSARSADAPDPHRRRRGISGRAGGAAPSSRARALRRRMATGRAELQRRRRPQLALVEPSGIARRRFARARESARLRREADARRRSAASNRGGVPGGSRRAETLARSSAERGRARELRSGGAPLPGRSRHEHRARRRAGVRTEADIQLAIGGSSLESARRARARDRGGTMNRSGARNHRQRARRSRREASVDGSARHRSPRRRGRRLRRAPCSGAPRAA